ncbi:MAG: N-acetylmuramoyl-L-alanine amidase family protein, partial [Candidatus Margulisiibacteriota bacterium]
LTRNEDRRSNLKEVVEFANKTKADLLISIHYNSTENSQISGTETYYFNPRSRKFAEIMHETIIQGIKRKDRGLRRVPFYVIKNCVIPSVLLEPIYLSNPEESNLAGSSDFQEEVANDIVKGVKVYFRSKSD